MVRKRQQYISHVAGDENLPQEVEDFKELQIKKGIERITREKVIRDGEESRVDGVCVCVCVHRKGESEGLRSYLKLVNRLRSVQA